MNDFFPKLEDFRHKTILNFLLIAFVFTLDLLTPLGYAVWILYLIPLIAAPYKTAVSQKVYLPAALITVLIWTAYFADAPGISRFMGFVNRSAMTLILWAVTLIQLQRAAAFRKLARSDEELRKSEERFRIAQEISPDGFLSFKPKFDNNGNLIDFIFTYMNPAAGRMSGTNPRDLIGRSILEVFPGQKETRFFETYRKVYLTGEASEFIDHYKGETITEEKWFRIVTVPTKEGIEVLSQDITEARDAEEKLRQSEERFRVAQEMSPYGFTIFQPKFDEHGNVTDFIFAYENPAVAKMNGTIPEEVIGKTLLELFPSARDTSFFNIYQWALQTGKPQEMEEYYPGSDAAGDKWYRLLVVPTNDGIAALAQDITEQKRHEVSLRESEERFRTMADNISQFAWMADSKGSVLWYNKRWYDYTGVTPEEMEDQGWKKIHHPDYVGRATEKFNHSIEYGVSWEDTFPLKGKDGTYRWFLSRALPIKNENGKIVRWFGTNTDITEQIEYQEKLLNSEEQMRLLSEELQAKQQRFERAEELAHVGSWVMDVKTGEMELSDELKRILGLEPSRKKILISDYMKFVHPDDRKRLTETTSRYHREGRPLEIEYRIVRTDGQVRYIHGVSGTGHQEFMGNVRYGAAKDITERKLTEIALAGSEAKLLEAQKLTGVGSFSADLITGKIEWTEEIYKIYEIDPQMEPPPFEQFTTMWHPEDRPWIEKTIKDGIENNKFISFEGRLLLPKGKVKYISYVSKTVFDAEGKPLKRVGAAVDITERKLQQIKLEEAFRRLQESENQLKAAQKLAKVGSFSINYTEGEKVEWSEEMFRIYGRDVSEGTPTVQEAIKMIHPDDREHTVQVIQSVKEEKITMEVDYRILTPGRKVKYLHTVFNPLTGSSGDFIQLFGTSLDITENMKQQAVLQQTLEKLERSNEELEQFAYVASHDLQEPLRMVSSYVGILEKRYKEQLDEKARKYISFAVEGAKRMSSLIMDLLTYSRVTSKAKEFQEVDLNSTYNDVLRDLQILTKERGAKITSTKLPVLNADPTQMHQLLQNLIGNAVKFHGERPPEVSLSAKKVEDGWLFSVKDNGIGIDTQYFDRIFQVFQRLHERDQYGGTGIGLAVCKKIVERHGGRIWVESREGKGTTFYFTIPEQNNFVGSEESSGFEITSGKTE